MYIFILHPGQQGWEKGMQLKVTISKHTVSLLKKNIQTRTARNTLNNQNNWNSLQFGSGTYAEITCEFLKARIEQDKNLCFFSITTIDNDYIFCSRQTTLGG